MENYTINCKSGSYNVGGLCGRCDYGAIQNCYAIGSVTGGNNVGGLIGYVGTSCSIWQCYSTVSVMGNTNVGGLIGIKETSSSSTIECYSTGSVSGISRVGGLIGYRSTGSGSVENCYSTGSVIGTSDVGGLVGYSTDKVLNSFWDMDTSGQLTSNGGTGKTTTDMKLISTFSLSGWDFDPSWIDGDSQNWTLTDEGAEYPKLKWQVLPHYHGGWGTANNPYRIADVNDILILTDSWWDLNSDFILLNDIDMKGMVFCKAIIAPHTERYSAGFGGVFNGNGKKITNFTISGGNNAYLGLFGHLNINSQLLNLGIENFTIRGTSGAVYVGALAAYTYYTFVQNCYSKGYIEANCRVGGLVGQNYYSTINNCYSSSTVIGDAIVGGLVGYNANGIISNCYSRGTVSGASSGGGLLGANVDGSVFNSFWDMDTSGQLTSSGGTGKTTFQMQEINTFLDSGWDFVDETARGSCNYWHISENGYAELAVFNGVIPHQTDGEGTPENPYVISDANDLGTIWYRPSSCYVLDNEINLDYIEWNMAVIPSFSGVIDGNGYCIHNMSISGTGNYSGLVGRLSGNIRNLGINNCTVNSSSVSIYTGGLVGQNYYGDISECYSTGTIHGYCYIGGLVGHNIWGSISRSYSTGSVGGFSDSSNIGGLVGYSLFGSIMNCYSSSDVYGYQDIGGLIGYCTHDKISQCYSAGHVRGTRTFGGLVGSCTVNVLNCFWDKDTSGLSPGCGIHKTTGEMMSISTYTSAGWNFTNMNNDKAEWMMLREGEDYPRLAWQPIYPGDIAGLYGVDIQDLIEIANNWLKQDCSLGCEQADIDNNNSVDLSDLLIIMDNWLLGI